MSGYYIIGCHAFIFQIGNVLVLVLGLELSIWFSNCNSTSLELAVIPILVKNVNVKILISDFFPQLTVVKSSRIVHLRYSKITIHL